MKFFSVLQVKSHRALRHKHRRLDKSEPLIHLRISGEPRCTKESLKMGRRLAEAAEDSPSRTEKRNELCQQGRTPVRHHIEDVGYINEMKLEERVS